MYNHKEIENKWQKHWLKNKSFKTTNVSNKKFYVLDMFPYPSGSGLHVGHIKGYTATDIIARQKRLQGYDVMHPIGWDAFGLPAEQYAIKTGNHPKEFTLKNINNFRKQLQGLGFSYDYDKEVNTTDIEYFKTTQWIFIQLYKNNLAEIKDIDVNWCQGLGTVLADEEVIKLENGGKISERGGFPVVKKPMKQWVLKITKYAERLYKDLDNINWPKSLKLLQKNWIKNKDGSINLRDWIFSRQRYWGEPFPIAFDKNGKILLLENLPIKLPELEKICPSGKGESPLANADEWLYFMVDGKKYRRETNTMPQWAGSCWYYLGYILKKSDKSYLDIKSKEAQKLFKKWLPIDLYIGGQEHAVLHLLYARFWHKFLYDIKIVPTKEPFNKVINQGMILGPDGQKMSKSKGNVINPDVIIKDFGADTLRLYEMFMGPIEETKQWSKKGAKSIYKWLERVYRVVTQIIKISSRSKMTFYYNKFIKDTTDNIDNLKFNVAISKMMIFVNNLYKNPEINKKEIQGFLVILSIFAPHISEELLSFLNCKNIQNQTWPNFEEKLIKKNNIMVPIQINGKLRGLIEIKNEDDEKNIISKSKKINNIKKHLKNKIILKEIYIPLKIINFVVK